MKLVYSGNVKKAADEKKEEKKEDTPAPGEGDGEEGLSPFYYLHMLVYQNQIRENNYSTLIRSECE